MAGYPDCSPVSTWRTSVYFLSAIRGKFDVKLAYLSCILFDLIFVPLFISMTGGLNSSFYLLYYLMISVAAYLLTFWFAVATTAIASVTYIVVVWPTLTIAGYYDFSLRIGMLWALFLGISYVAEFLRRSEGRLMKLFDTLNHADRRTRAVTGAT